MAIDPKLQDWPQPNEQDLPLAVAAEDVLNLGDELALALSSLDGSIRNRFVDLMARAWEHTPSVPASMRHLLQLLQFEQDDGLEQFAKTALDQPARFLMLFGLMGHSNLLGSWLSRGVWRYWLSPLGEYPIDFPEKLRELFCPTVSPDNAQALGFMLQADFVRYFQHHHAAAMCEIAAGDLLRNAPFETTIRRISDLADVSVQTALDFAHAQVSAKFGTPVDSDGAPLGLCVLAMGKLGGRELNYSSDIDLILVCEGEGKTQGGPRSIDAISHATKVVELAIRCLADQGPLGPAYRVDTRLRPDGNSGPLVRTLSATIAYYRQRGATWERQALLKLRPIAGDLTLGWQLHAELQSFVHRRYLSVRAINEIKALKHRIELRTESIDDTYRDVKTGFGGIRDIEFVVQFLQLVNGGRMPSVRSPNTLEALSLLVAAGCLRADEAGDLATSYRLLRRIEHGLQLESGQQTHRIDSNPSKLAALAARLGYRDKPNQSAAKQMYLDLARVTVKTRGLLLRLFTGLFKAEPDAPSLADLALDPDIDAAKAAPLLDPFKFSDNAQVCTLIHRMAAETEAFRRFAPRTRTYLASALPGILAWAGGTSDGLRALATLDRLISCLGAKGVFYELLAERPDVLAEVGRLCTDAGWLVGSIERRPGLMDQFLDGLRTGVEFDRERFVTSLASRRELMPVTEALQWSRDSAFLEIAAGDLSGAMKPEEVWGALAEVAEAILVAAVDESIAREAKRDKLDDALMEEARRRLCVVAMGKLGGETLDYGSDLDVVFVAEPSDALKIAFFERVAQGVVRLLSSEANVYEVDLRLRPQGSRGSTVSTVEGFAHHLEHGLAFWERIALVRGRVVYGGGGLVGGIIASKLIDACYRNPLPSDAAIATKEMRARQEREAGSLSVKRGPGGLADADFGLALAQLAFGFSRVECRESNTFIAFEHCMAVAPIAIRDSLTVLRDGTVVHRRWTQRMKLRFGSTPADVPRLSSEAVTTGHASGRLTASSVSDGESDARRDEEAMSIRETRASVRRAFDVVMTWIASLNDDGQEP